MTESHLGTSDLQTPEDRIEMLERQLKRLELALEVMRAKVDYYEERAFPIEIQEAKARAEAAAGLGPPIPTFGPGDQEMIQIAGKLGDPPLYVTRDEYYRLTQCGGQP